jgi:hypothetical protein
MTTTQIQQALAEYVDMAAARGALDQRMFELKRTIVLGLNPDEVRRFEVDGTVVTVDRNAANITIAEMERVPS